MQFLNTKPTVTRCECCGRFFVPKTNKATKYCDRIVKNNLTCKQIAPSLKHKKIVSDDKVVEAYDRNKRKMYRRYERNDGKVYMPKKGLTTMIFTIGMTMQPKQEISISMEQYLQKRH